MRAGPGRACARGGRGAPGRPPPRCALAGQGGSGSGTGTERGALSLTRALGACRWLLVRLGWRTDGLPLSFPLESARTRCRVTWDL